MAKEKQIFSITTNLSRYGGAQKVLMDLHRGLKNNYDAKIIGRQRYDTLHPKYGINKNEYIFLDNPFQLNNKILIVHARNIIPLLVILKKILFLNTEIIYVSHNVYSTHKKITFLPKHVVSISKKVTNNLIEYFNCDKNKIRLIYNGIKDCANKNLSYNFNKDGKIRILYPARINGVKRQLAIVEELKNKLSKDIEIHFAGVGNDYEILKKECEVLSNFKVLGFVDNMNDLIPKYDFLMLFSLQEGLPISLIEGIMHSKPLLVNDVGGNFEIGIPGYNSIEIIDFLDLAIKLNGLISLSEKKYKDMASNSRTLYLEKFQYDKMVNNYIGLIESIIKED